LALLLCTQPRLLSLWPEETKEFHMPNGFDSDAEGKKLFGMFAACESSDLGRGMFEVAPRSAAIISVRYEKRVSICR
jgi:hypothetical protein